MYAYQKMTFAVGRIRKCTLKLKLLVFLFCSPEVGLSYHVKCADRSAPCPNLRVSANRPIVHFGDERQFPLKSSRLKNLYLRGTASRLENVLWDGLLAPEGSDRVPNDLRILHDMIALLQENKTRSFNFNVHFLIRPTANVIF